MNPPEEYPFDFFVHEAGHVVVNYALGASIVYVQTTGKSEHPFATGSDLTEPVARVKISLAGLMAEAAFLDQDNERFFGQYEEMIRIRPKQPDWKNLTDTEQKIMRHARTDLSLAFVDAKDIIGRDDPNRICGLLKTAWVEVHDIIRRNGQELKAVTADIKQWNQDGLSMREILRWGGDSGRRSISVKRQGIVNGTLV
jgi:hypothetical protein